MCKRTTHTHNINIHKTIKYVACWTTHSVPYKIYTKLMTRSLVELITQSRNSFPQKGSIRKRLGANTILLGNPSPDNNKKRILFGSYVMVYTGTTNTLKIRSTPSISSNESYEDGRNFFM